MSLTDYFMKAAQDAANNIEERIAQLNAELAEIEKQKTAIESNRATLRSALERPANYQVTSGGDYPCPLCWVDEGKISPLRPVPSQSRDDIFRCRVCHYEAVIPG